MNRKYIADIVMRLFLYADMCKMIHYTTRKMHCHTLCDDVRDTIMEFADDLAEKAFGHTGKPNFNDFSLRLSVKKSSDIATICKNVVDLVEGLRKGIEKNDKYTGIVSIIDDFKSDMAQKVYLANFDNVSDARLIEAVTKAINKIKLNEGIFDPDDNNEIYDIDTNKKRFRCNWNLVSGAGLGAIRNVDSGREEFSSKEEAKNYLMNVLMKYKGQRIYATECNVEVCKSSLADDYWDYVWCADNAPVDRILGVQ